VGNLQWGFWHGDFLSPGISEAFLGEGSESRGRDGHQWEAVHAAKPETVKIFNKLSYFYVA
jgi:hypothetical protein